MLGKLFKHEWKCTWKAGCIMLLGLVLVSFFGWFSFQAPIWRSMANESYYSGISVWDLMSFGTLFMYVILLVGLNYGIIIYMGVRFYKTMYTDEGYTDTYPARIQASDSGEQDPEQRTVDHTDDGRDRAVRDNTDIFHGGRVYP